MINNNNAVETATSIIVAINDILFEMPVGEKLFGKDIAEELGASMGVDKALALSLIRLAIGCSEEHASKPGRFGGIERIDPNAPPPVPKAKKPRKQAADTTEAQPTAEVAAAPTETLVAPTPSGPTGRLRSGYRPQGAVSAISAAAVTSEE